MNLAKVALAAVAVLGCIAGLPSPSRAAPVVFYVPIRVSGIPSEFQSVSIHCSVGSDHGSVAIGSRRLPLAGAVEGRVVIFAAAPADVWIDAHANYVCGLNFTGRTASEPSGYSTWTRTSADGRSLPFSTLRSDYAGYIPLASGTHAVLRAQGELRPEVITEFNLHGACPCGCGGDFDKGTAACDPQGRSSTLISPPLLPFDPGPQERRDAGPRPAPFDRLHGGRTPSAPETRTRLTFTTAMMTVAGAGRSVFVPP